MKRKKALDEALTDAVCAVEEAADNVRRLEDLLTEDWEEGEPIYLTQRQAEVLHDFLQARLGAMGSEKQYGLMASEVSILLNIKERAYEVARG